MFSRFQSTLMILAIAFCCFFMNLGASALFEEDEPKNAECGREMFMRGDWIVPTYNEELRTDKPVLLYWLMICSFHLFGMNEFAARLPSAMMASGTLFLVGFCANRLFQKKSGTLTSVILATAVMFTIISRASTPDATLIFFITAVMLIFLFNLSVMNNTMENFSWPQSVVPENSITYFFMGILMGLAVLAKGPVGVVLPCLILGFFVVISRLIFTIDLSGKSLLTRVKTILIEMTRPSILWKGMWSLKPHVMLPVAAVVFLPWYISVTILTDGEWLAGFLGKHNVGRFISPMEKHSGPVFYYLPVIGIGFFPWSMFLFMTFFHAYKKIRENNCLNTTQESIAYSPSKNQVLHLFLASWGGVYLTFFSFAQTKLPNYVLPVYPVLALLTASYLGEWQFQKFEMRSIWMKMASWGYVVTGVVLSIALYTGSRILFPTGYFSLEPGIVILSFGILSIYILHLGRRTFYVKLIGTMSVLFSIVLFNYVAPQLSRQQDGVILGRVLLEKYPENAELATYNYFSANLPFYAERKISRFQHPEHLHAYLEDRSHLLIIRAENWEELKKQLPENVSIIKRVPRFLRLHDLLLLGVENQKDTIAEIPEDKVQR